MVCFLESRIICPLGDRGGLVECKKQTSYIFLRHREFRYHNIFVENRSFPKMKKIVLTCGQNFLDSSKTSGEYFSSLNLNLKKMIPLKFRGKDFPGVGSNPHNSLFWSKMSTFFVKMVCELGSQVHTFSQACSAL
jgi:hypothetical protein